MRTLVIIPAYNESKNLEKLINDIKSYGYEYIIINDRSTDRTEELAKEKNFSILNLCLNVGIAGVTRIGFKYAKDHDYDCAVVVDGDGQHQPKCVHSLIKCIENGSDYALGSRFVQSKKPWSFRMIGSRIISFLIKIKTGKTIKDPTSGMRALGKNVIEEFSVSMNYYAEPDALCHLIKRGYKIEEVQVEMLEREDGISYFVNPIKSIKYMISEIISLIFIQW